MRVLVCGSRTFEDVDVLENILSALIPFDDKTHTVIHGSARGADTLAANYCSGWCHILAFPADWKAEPRRAGYIRNQQMLDEGQPDLVVAFVDKPLAESKGTDMMVNLARKGGIKTIVVQVIS